MKYNRLLSISISIGILLAVWAVIEKSTTSGQAADTDPASPSPSPTATVTKGPIQDAGPFGNYVKHNPGIESSKATANRKHPKTDSWFFVQLFSKDNGTTFYVRYIITDQYGVPTEWHSYFSHDINEDQGSSLFSTKFDYSMGINVSTTSDGKEVTITGTDTSDKKSKTWTSKTDDSGNHQDDGDTSWIDPT